MRRQLTAYLSEEEFHRLRDEADERGITLSRYVKERLFQSEGGSGLTFSDATSREWGIGVCHFEVTPAREKTNAAWAKMIYRVSASSG